MNTKEINKNIKKLKKTSEKQLKNVSLLVNNIIMYRVKDISTIEHILDSLLDLTYIVDTEKTYYKLLDYYKNINLQAANNYESFYLEIITEENAPHVLKKEKKM